MSYRLIDTFQAIFQGKRYIHRDASRGDFVAIHLYEDLYTVWDSTQDPHPLRVYLAQTLRVPEISVRVIQPHVGGAFGLKQPTSQEEPLIAYLSRKLGRG